jgi:hypothetical protein
MKKRLHRAFFHLLPFGLTATSALGQASPAAVAPPRYEGFQLPKLQGSLNYAISASERVDNGYNGNGMTDYSTNFGGDLAYLSNSQTHPFGVIYSGGYLVGTSEQPSSFYQNLGLSQSLTLQRWSVVMSDSVSYLPQTATAGLSGIPGVGDGGVPPVDTGVDNGQTILTQNSNRVVNTFSASVQRGLTGKTSLNVFGSYGLVDYTGDSQGSGVSGLNSSQNSVGGGFSHRVDARSSFSANYIYSRFEYGGRYGYSLASQSLNFGYTHQFTRKVSVNVSVGPQRTSSVALVDPTYNLAANVGVSYSGRFASYSAGYNSGTNGGSGVATGAMTQSATASISRPLGRAWFGNAGLTYSRSANLPVLGGPAFTTNAVVGTTQFNRALRRNLSTFVSYTAQRQSLVGSVQSSNVFSGLSQVIGFGLTYSPASRHLGGR